MTADELAAVVGAAAAHELDSALDRIKHCLGQLNDAQVWHRSQPGLNSIGNLILPLCGNLRQWIVSGLGGAPDVRNRPAEFAELGPLPKGELLRRLEAVVDEEIVHITRLQDVLAYHGANVDQQHFDAFRNMVRDRVTILH